jgi:tRNA A37 methylthiotransferase MiaB
MRDVCFDQAYMYKYSQREKTHAHRKYVDDVSEADKGRRLAEVIDTFRAGSTANNTVEVGRTLLVLVEGHSKRSHTILTPL